MQVSIRFYTTDESEERIPKISNYYKNYLTFFCNPLFRDFPVNRLIQVYGDNKAELYYKNNYGGGKKKNDDDVNNESDSCLNNLNPKDENNIFSDTVKFKISKNSLTQTAIYNDNNDTTLNLNEDLHKKIKGQNKPIQGIEDLSHFSSKSLGKANKDDSLINELLKNLDKNTIESSINERIIDKIQKNKRISNNFSTTDKTKEDKTKKSSSITKHVVNTHHITMIYSRAYLFYIFLFD